MNKKDVEKEVNDLVVSEDQIALPPKISFDMMLLEKYKEDRDLDFQKFWKDNKEYLDELVFNNVKYVDIDFYETELPVLIENPILGSTYDLILNTKIANNIIHEELLDIPILNHSETFLENMNIKFESSEKERGGHILDIKIKDDLDDSCFLDNYFIMQILKNKITNKISAGKIVDGDNIKFETTLENYEILGFLGFEYKLMEFKYDIKDKNSFNFEEYTNSKLLIMESMEIFINDALETFINKSKSFSAIDLEISTSYIVDGKRRYYDNAIEFNQEFNSYYDKSIPKIPNREMVDDFKTNLKELLNLSNEFNENGKTIIKQRNSVKK